MAWVKKKPQAIPDEKDLPPLPQPPKSAKETESEKVLVVKELPMQPVRQVKLEDGTIANLITIEEALEELLNR